MKTFKELNEESRLEISFYLKDGEENHSGYGFVRTRNKKRRCYFVIWDKGVDCERVSISLHQKTWGKAFDDMRTLKDVFFYDWETDVQFQKYDTSGGICLCLQRQTGRCDG